MTDGKDIEDWIETAGISKKHRFDPFFRVGIQTRIDNGGAFCAVYHKETKEAIKGGLEATKEQLERLDQLGVLEAEQL